MKEIKFIDLNNSLVQKVAELGIESIHGDYFKHASESAYSVMMTASNPQFTFGGGIDAMFVKYFPYYCSKKKYGMNHGNERIGNVCFCITVDEDYKASEKLVREAIEFGLRTLAPFERLCISGLGTGIGGMSEEEFVNILKEII